MDLILKNGTVVTLDGKGTIAQAVAVTRSRTDGHIYAVGSDAEIVPLAGGDSTAVIDLQGRTVVPGLVESHVHALGSSVTLTSQLNAGTPPNRAIPDVVERLREKALEVEKGTWIIGRGYDDTLIKDMRHITRYDIDDAVPDNPVLIRHVSGHLVYLNSKAMETAGIKDDAADPPGGHWDRENGKINGVGYESARDAVRHYLPKPTLEEMAEALAWGSKQLVKVGITSLHDLGMAGAGLPHGDAFMAFQKACFSESFAPRAYVMQRIQTLGLESPPFETVVPRMNWAGLRTGFGNNRVKVGAIKISQDGSIQGHSGALTRGYHDRPEEHGIIWLQPDDLNKAVESSHLGGFQVSIHGNGDWAINTVLDAYEYALSRHPVSDHRHRIEHCQAVREDQLDRMQRLGVLASFFNLHVYYWGDRHRDLFLGPERSARISPLKGAVERGIVFGCHSDWAVAPVDPLFNVHVGVNRKTRDGKELGPEFRIDAEQALRSMTIDAAFLAFEEDIKGSIEPGKLADMVVLTDNPLDMPPDKIDDVEIDYTIIGGDIVYDRARDGGSRKDERHARDPNRETAYGDGGVSFDL